MTERYSVETFMRIYEDDHGWFYEIRPDADGLGCVEVRYSDGEAETRRRERPETRPHGSA